MKAIMKAIFAAILFLLMVSLTSFEMKDKDRKIGNSETLYGLYAFDGRLYIDHQLEKLCGDDTGFSVVKHKGSFIIKHESYGIYPSSDGRQYVNPQNQTEEDWCECFVEQDPTDAFVKM